MRDTRRNREIIERWPDVFAAEFTGSSRAWVEALTTAGAAPPDGTGLVWADLHSTRLYEWRRND